MKKTEVVPIEPWEAMEMANMEGSPVVVLTGEAIKDAKGKIMVVKCEVTH